jgi:lipoprotein-releasing system permease protein
MDLTGILRGAQGRQQTAAVRGLPADALEKDRGMGARLAFSEGAFDLGEPDSILLGTELARRLNVRLGDRITLLSVSGFLPGEASPEDSAFTVRGIFDSGFYEYDLGWAFINLELAEKLEGKDRPSLGIKIKNRWQDARFLARVREITGSVSSLRSWRDYNKAFFSALRTEKLLMFVLVGLIVIVVGLNIFQAQRKAVLERREEIGLLRAVGAADRDLRLIFVWDGIIIGAIGAGLGITLGLLLSYHIGPFFAVLEVLVNGFLSFLNFILGGFLRSGDIEGNFTIFSPAIFYIKEIPSRVIPLEVFLIFMFGFLSAVLAAWFASGRVSRTNPAEVLRYE